MSGAANYVRDFVQQESYVWLTGRPMNNQCLTASEDYPFSPTRIKLYLPIPVSLEGQYQCSPHQTKKIWTSHDSLHEKNTFKESPSNCFLGLLVSLTAAGSLGIQSKGRGERSQRKGQDG